LNIIINFKKVECEIVPKEKFILLDSKIGRAAGRLISTWLLRDVRIETVWGLEDLP